MRLHKMIGATLPGQVYFVGIDMDYVESATQATVSNAPVQLAGGEALAEHELTLASDAAASATAADLLADFRAPRVAGATLARIDPPASERAFAGFAVIATVVSAVMGLIAVLFLLKREHASAGLQDDPYECGCQ